ncbi:MAG TPA: hypothetical protein VD963_04115 [Phycisphaerales bacterium]|nr:hypothetical protein [Phycisphaerales bacterium]
MHPPALPYQPEEIFHRVLRGWMLDLLELRRRGLDQPRAQALRPARWDALRASPARVAGTVRAPRPAGS